MKKSILSIALLSMLFVLGACSAKSDDGGDSAEDTAFLNTVKGKSIYQEAGFTTKLGEFSANRKAITGKMVTDMGVTITFASATTRGKATYNSKEIATGDTLIVTVEMTGDTTADVTIEGESTQKLHFK